MKVTEDLSPALLRKQAEGLLVLAHSLSNPLQNGLLQVSARLYLVLADRWENGRINRETVEQEISVFADRMHRYTTAVVTEQRASAVIGITQMAQRLDICHVWLLTGRNKDQETE